MRTVFRFLVAVLVVMLAGISAAHADEFRGLYVDAFYPHLGLKSHDQVTQMVNAAKAANFNALIVQVRKRGDAYYNSHVEPKASDIAADYDPLADVITQAHALGMEVHAWLSVYEVWHDIYPEADDRHITKLHPEWLMSDVGGRTKFVDGKIFVDPGIPQIQDQFVSVVADVLTNYNVDGINLDNCRYPTHKFGYNPLSVARYNEASGKSGTPDPEDKQWRLWRSSQVTVLVSKVHDEIVRTKPGVKLSASVMTHSGAEANQRFLQDWDAWTRDGLVDFVIPMLYIVEKDLPAKLPISLGSAHDRHVYIGLGGYRISSEEAAKEIAACRGAGARGVVFYSYHCMGPNSVEETYTRMSDLVSGSFAEPSAVPAMPWKEQN